MSGFLYLASPYSHPDPAIRHWRYVQACKAAASMMERGRRVFSPIAHSHSVEQFGMTEIHDGTFWMKQDAPLLVHASELVVLMLEGWQDSKGVQEEVRICTLVGKPIEYMGWHGNDTAGSAETRSR